jgi:hypothetical protein
VFSSKIVSGVDVNRPRMADVDIKIDHWGKLHVQVHDMQIRLILTQKLEIKTLPLQRLSQFNQSKL